MYQLYIDFDGVIWDSWSIYDRIIEEKDKKLYDNYKKNTLTSEDIIKMREIFKDLDFEKAFQESNQLNDSIKHIKYLQDQNMFNIKVLTHCNSENEIKNKQKIIDKHLDNIMVIPVYQPNCKTTAVDPKGTILIDDYSKNIQAWINAGGLGIKFDDEENDLFHSIYSLDKVIDIINLNEKITLIKK